MSDTTDMSNGSAAISRHSNAWATLRDILQRYGTVFGMVLLAFIFTILSEGRFASIANVLSILNNGAVLTVMAIGLTMPLILGDFDLSFSYIATFGGILATGLMANSGVPVPLAILVVIAVAALIGLFNGFIVTKYNVHSLVATLGMSSLMTGAIYLYSGGNQISVGIPAGFLVIGRGELVGIPVPVFIAAVFIAVMWLVMEHMVPGRKMYAVGGNAQAAYLSGINIVRYRRAGFILSAVFSAIAGVMLASLLNIGHPQAATGMMLDAYTACFLGAVTIKRGEFNILGTAIGVLFLSIIINGVTMIGAEFWVQSAVKGVVLISAVALSGITGKFRT